MIYLLSWGIVILGPFLGLMVSILDRSLWPCFFSIVMSLPFFAVTRIWAYCPHCHELKQRHARVCPHCTRDMPARKAFSH